MQLRKVTMVNMLLSLVLFVSYVSAAVLAPRETAAATCAGLSVKSNDGNRKVAIVIDSSGSMSSSDPYNLRLAAGRALNAWLVTSAEASGSRQADLVTVIDFSSAPHLDYPLGDPGKANSSFNSIGAYGGTYIAGGVNMSIAQLGTTGTGDIAKRSTIIVFTDGEDSDTKTLVAQINRASALGIRVSFGFLDADASVQDSTVLQAISNSGGVYSTITTSDASNNFINFAILNGLTYNDNPQGNNNTLLAGLSITTFISGTQTQSVVYNAQNNEKIIFSIKSINAGILTAQALINGAVQNSTTTSSLGTSLLTVSASSAGLITIQVTAKTAPSNAIFIVGATSNMPIQNCTVGVTNTDTGSGGGLSTGAKAGLGVGITALIAGLGLGAFFLWKYFFAPSTPPSAPLQGHGAPEYTGGQEGVGNGGEKGIVTSNTTPMYHPQAPMSPHQSPMNYPQGPMNPHEAPMNYPQGPMNPHEAPMHYPQGPMDPHQSPMNYPQGPMDPPQAPMDPPQAPIDPSQAPMHSPQMPMDPHQSPMNYPQGPMDPPQAPMDPPQLPMDPSQAPMNYPQAPVGPHQAPVYPHGAPTYPDGSQYIPFAAVPPIIATAFKNKHHRHHHHLGPMHPCSTIPCSINNSTHVCKDPNVEPKGPCACTDPNCALNKPEHNCKEACECTDENCPVTQEQKKW